jgi:hypothetical protein
VSATDTNGTARRAVGAGALAGLATIGTTFLALLAIGFVNAPWVIGLFGAPSLTGRITNVVDLPPWAARPFAARLAGALLAPWNGAQVAPLGGGYTSGFGEPPVRLSIAHFGAVLLLALVVTVVGLVVRRRTARSLRGRAVTVCVASVVVAAVAAVGAALLRYDWPKYQPPRIVGRAETEAVHWSHAPLRYGLAALLLTLLLSSFAFGLVRLLPSPFGALLRRAGIVVGACFLAFGLLFPVFVVSDGLHGIGVLDALGRPSEFSSAVGGFAIPLALAAPVSVTQDYGSPFLISDTASADHAANPAAIFHRQSFQWALELDQRGRLYQFAALLGGWAIAVAGLITAAVLAALAWAAIASCREARGTTPRRGARIGALQGLSIGLLVFIVSVVSSYSLGGLPPQAKGLSGPDLWGTPTLAMLYTIAVVAAVCAASGALYGTLVKRRAKPVVSPLGPAG